jgi:hypothetical protein
MSNPLLEALKKRNKQSESVTTESWNKLATGKNVGFFYPKKLIS